MLGTARPSSPGLRPDGPCCPQASGLAANPSMITPGFRAQDQLFIPGPALALAEQDRYRLFARTVMPRFIQARPTLAQAYCPDNGRAPVDPALLARIFHTPPAFCALRRFFGLKIARNRVVFPLRALLGVRSRLMSSNKAVFADTPPVAFEPSIGLPRHSARRRRQRHQSPVAPPKQRLQGIGTAQLHIDPTHAHPHLRGDLQ